MREASDERRSLQGAQVGAVIAVTDLERAREFYEGQLGLAGEPTPGGWLVRAGAQTVCYLLAGIESAGSADWPVASFRVSDARAAVRELRGRGVTFLGSDEVGFTVDRDGVSVATTGIAVAWMRDPDGSILTVYSPTEPGSDAAAIPRPGSERP